MKYLRTETNKQHIKENAKINNEIDGNFKLIRFFKGNLKLTFHLKNMKTFLPYFRFKKK